MIVELFIASLALFLWLHVEAGVVRAMAYNVMFIAGVSTVLFNANPLLRYDGYYMLADYLEMPNLRARARCAHEVPVRVSISSVTGRPPPEPRCR